MNKVKSTALIVDDEKDIRELIEMAFASLNIDCVLSPTIKDAIRQLKQQHTKLDFCITDMRLPDGDGLDLVTHIQKHYPELPVCVITAHGNVELAVESLKKGAFDFVNKPFDLKQLRTMATSAMKLSNKSNVAKSVDAKSTKEGVTSSNIRLIGESATMKKLEEVIFKLARSQAPVFINGESGTGKELVAHSIHEQSARREGPFVPVNCGAIPENLVESEFFGYKKGAFTGANNDHHGLFVAANGGTIFLDEVADLPLSMQVKLLRAIQERAIRPIGGDAEISVDVRVLSATHKDLSQLVKDGGFREDLYYRLNVISLGIPPLRSRGDDIAVLTEFIIGKMSKIQGCSYELSQEALDKLNQYEFPGNVRELENILERAVTFCDNQKITTDNIQFSNRMIGKEETSDNNANSKFDIEFSLETPTVTNDENEFLLEIQTVTSDDSDSDSFTTVVPLPLESLPNTNDEICMPEDVDDLEVYVAKVEKIVIEKALNKNKHDQQETADKLKISLRTLRYKLKKYNIGK